MDGYPGGVKYGAHYSANKLCQTINTRYNYVYAELPFYV